MHEDCNTRRYHLLSPPPAYGHHSLLQNTKGNKGAQNLKVVSLATHYFCINRTKGLQPTDSTPWPDRFSSVLHFRRFVVSYSILKSIIYFQLSPVKGVKYVQSPLRVCICEPCDGPLFQSGLLKDYTSSIKQPFLLLQPLLFLAHWSDLLFFLFLSF